MDTNEAAFGFMVQAVLRRYDALSEHDPEEAVRFWKTASADFVLFGNPGCETGTPSKTRNGMLTFWKNRVWLASLGSDAYTPRDADLTTSHVERFVFTNEAQTGASVWVKQETKGTEENAIKEHRWQEVTKELIESITATEQLPQQNPQKVTCIEIWRDTWQKRENMWRWTRRVCVERFFV